MWGFLKNLLPDPKAAFERALIEQAVVALRDGKRFQFVVAEIGGEDRITQFLVRLSVQYGANVRGSCCSGLLTIYSESIDHGLETVIATRRLESSW